MKYSAFLLVSLISATAFAQVKMTLAQWNEWRTQNEGYSHQISRVALGNATKLDLKQPPSCSSPGPQVQIVQMNFKDGSTENYLIHQTSNQSWIDRDLMVVTFKAGKPVSTPHKIAFGVRYGGFRFEVSPELKKSCPTCERFKDVEDWTVTTVDLREVMNCPRPPRNEPISQPVVSSVRR